VKAGQAARRVCANRNLQLGSMPAPLWAAAHGIALRSTVGTAAGLTLLEGDLRSRFARWQALERPAMAMAA
jgi:hypothetical protein